MSSVKARPLQPSQERPATAPKMTAGTAVETDNTSVAIAVLRERTEVLGREMRELKDASRAQMLEMRLSQDKLNDKMDSVLTVMSEARGGWKTLMLVGGMAASLGAVLAWAVNRFAGGVT